VSSTPFLSRSFSSSSGLPGPPSAENWFTFRTSTFGHMSGTPSLFASSGIPSKLSSMNLARKIGLAW
jgi:hypothetical protein